MKNTTINQAVVEKCLQDGAKSMSELYKALGGKSKASGSFSSKIRTLCPNVDDRLKANQVVKPENSNKPSDATKPAKNKSSLKFSRHSKNPFRPSSSYGVAFDILAAHPKGMNKDELVRLLAKTTGKSEKLAGYDASVVLSAKESPTGMRHRSCKEGFWIHKENKFVKLMLP